MARYQPLLRIPSFRAAQSFYWHNQHSFILTVSVLHRSPICILCEPWDLSFLGLDKRFRNQLQGDCRSP